MHDVRRGSSQLRLVLLTVALTVAATLLGSLLVMNLWSEGNPVSHKIRTDYGVRDSQFWRTAGGLYGFPMIGGNRIEPLVNGESLTAMLEAVRGARKSVTFETYIFWSGEVGDRFVDAFVERARAGVPTHLLLDWVGSADLSEEAIDEMLAAGVVVHRYHAPAWYVLDKLNNRTHRKILVVDGRIGFIGGVGIADHWQGDARSPEEWRDLHFRVEGPVVAGLQGTFMENWLAVGASVLHGERYFPELEPLGETRAQVIESSADEGSESVRLVYLLAIAAARERILIGNAYFVPDGLTIESLIEAKQRGVDVQIIVPGRITDVEIVRKASRASWGPLLEAGIAIYEYQPTMYHCKIMIVDDVLVLVGSANFDNRSFSLNDEANLTVWDPELARGQAALFEEDISRSKRVSLAEWNQRPLREKISDAIAGWLGPQL